MRNVVLQRWLVLLGAAFLAALVAVAVARHDSASGSPALPSAAPAPGGGWYEARAAILINPKNRRTDCDIALTGKTMGVAHPVLPCRVQLYVELGNKKVLTRVIGRGAPRRSEFGVTRALADELGLHGVQQIKWRFAAAPS